MAAAIAGPVAIFDQLQARSLVWLGVVAVMACASNDTDPPHRPGTRVDRSGSPLLRANEAELRSFREGDALFEATVRESDGLGPLYVRDSCAACHQADGRGPGFVNLLAPFSSLAKSELRTL